MKEALLIPPVMADYWKNRPDNFYLPQDSFSESIGNCRNG